MAPVSKQWWHCVQAKASWHKHHTTSASFCFGVGKATGPQTRFQAEPLQADYKKQHFMSSVSKLHLQQPRVPLISTWPISEGLFETSDLDSRLKVRVQALRTNKLVIKTHPSRTSWNEETETCQQQNWTLFELIISYPTVYAFAWWEIWKHVCIHVCGFAV